MTTYDSIVTPTEWLCSSCGQRRADHECLGGFQRQRVPFAAMLRVHNEARWISEVLESIRPLCERIFVMDDHSTDNTIELSQRFRLGANQAEQVKVYNSPFEGLNESRDKNWLYDRIIRECEPEWILCVDGDEVLEMRGPDIIREHCAQTKLVAKDVVKGGGVHVTEYEAVPVADSYKLPIAFLWNDREHWRTDRIYGDFWRPSLFRPFIPSPDKPDDMLVAKEFRFKATPFGRHVNSNQPNLHCSSVPQRRIHGAKMLPARLKHYGYMLREDRVRKLDNYTAIDWDNKAEDCYRHMCQGDAPKLSELPKIRALLASGTLMQSDVDFLLNVPPDATLVHAGPLKIEPWDESTPWEMSAWARSQNA